MKQGEAYDPTAPDTDAPGRSAYVTTKDIRVVAVGLVFLSALLYPVFRVLVRNSERARCTKNMEGIMYSINQYADQNDDRYPPIFDPGSAGEPALQSSGTPYTWASVIQEYMKPSDSFRCPSADTDELTRSQDSQSVAGSFPLSYGMFAPMSSYNRSTVEDPDEAVVFGETSNLGTNKTFDPLPFTDASGQKMKYDGMIIGWNNNNFDGDDKSKFITRMAFPGSAGGVFLKNGEGRHDEGSFVMTVTGHIRNFHPDQARVARRYGKLYGSWPMPIDVKPH